MDFDLVTADAAAAASAAAGPTRPRSRSLGRAPKDQLPDAFDAPAPERRRRSASRERVNKDELRPLSPTLPEHEPEHEASGKSGAPTLEIMVAAMTEVASFFGARPELAALDVLSSSVPSVTLRTYMPGQKGTLVMFKYGLGLYSDGVVVFFHPWSSIMGWKANPEVERLAMYKYVAVAKKEVGVIMEFKSARDRKHFLDVSGAISEQVSLRRERSKSTADVIDAPIVVRAKSPPLLAVVPEEDAQSASSSERRQRRDSRPVSPDPAVPTPEGTSSAQDRGSRRLSHRGSSRVTSPDSDSSRHSQRSESRPLSPEPAGDLLAADTAASTPTTRPRGFSFTKKKPPAVSLEAMVAAMEKVASFFGCSDLDDMDVLSTSFADVALRGYMSSQKGTVVVFKYGIGLYSNDQVVFFHPWTHINDWSVPTGQERQACYKYRAVPQQETVVCFEFRHSKDRLHFLELCCLIGQQVADLRDRTVKP